MSKTGWTADSPDQQERINRGFDFILRMGNSITPRTFS